MRSYDGFNEILCSIIMCVRGVEKVFCFATAPKVVLCLKKNMQQIFDFAQFLVLRSVLLRILFIDKILEVLFLLSTTMRMRT